MMKFFLEFKEKNVDRKIKALKGKMCICDTLYMKRVYAVYALALGSKILSFCNSHLNFALEANLKLS